MIELQSTLDGKNEIKPDYGYMVDFTKLTSVNDLVMILSAMGISFPGTHPFINELKPFLNLENPFPLNPQNDTNGLPQLKKVD